MSLKITWKYLVAFIALNMIMGELHEQVHIQTGFAVCGCYGARDFNVWATCADCLNPGLAFLSTVTGPLFSYLVYWLAVFMLTRSLDAKMNKLALAVLFATLPFARIFTAFMGGGDEKTVMVALLGNQFSLPVIKVMAALLVTAICLPPLWIAVKHLPKKNRWWYAAGFTIGPLFFGVFWQRWVLKKALALDIWNDRYIAGTPVLVLIHFMLMLLLLIRFRRSLSA